MELKILLQLAEVLEGLLYELLVLFAELVVEVVAELHYLMVLS